MAANNKKFHLFDAVLMSVVVVMVAESAAPAAAIGPSQYFWWIFLLIFFFVPYGLVSSELGTTVLPILVKADCMTGCVKRLAIDGEVVWHGCTG